MRLDDIPKNKKPFQTPEGYFEKLPDKIQNRIDRQPTNTGKTVSFISKKNTWTLVAASISLLLVCSVMYFKSPFNQKDTNIAFTENSTHIDEAFANISAQDAKQFLLSSEIGTEDILTFAKEEAITLQTSTSREEEELLEEFLHNEIELSDIEELY